MQHESPLSFPTEFPVKVMGRDTPEFHSAIAGIFTRQVAPFDSLEVTHQPSREGRFISVTVTIVAQNREQLDALYSALSGHELVLMAL